MAEVTETQLPGVGVRLEFTTASGTIVGVITHRTGRRELVVYDRVDPDRCLAQIVLDGDDARTLAELLGASRVNEALTAVQQRIEGLAIEWLTVEPSSPFVGRTIAEGAFRTQTGVSIVAVIKDETTIPAPGPEHRFVGGETIVAVGTDEGLAALDRLLNG
ncbi:cation:proton antiporter regulatory subunit [Iamia sp. SCSIO 61187]|uniref:cation:proton antiporter regulatory subunit n=1 Tax=Iamia sp. SCSIO 61187 TaxID=2722752 RepID=UPI001C6278F1|nr:cation:proton antiporter regulatory subunit [Iamia sp. SCSIO 61187]QYG93113.1 cation:proton antiporter regulatory subunit [Iamia sp. SCSIO 61187]